MRPTNVLRVAALTWLLCSSSMASAQGAGGEKLGTVTFPVSCTPAASQQFVRAVALLHSFWYEEAVKAFTEVTVTDPSCAMGFWGVAMSMYYPLWYPPSEATLKAGLAVLDRAKRSEERRVGKEGRCRGWRYAEKKKRRCENESSRVR